MTTDCSNCGFSLDTCKSMAAERHHRGAPCCVICDVLGGDTHIPETLDTTDIRPDSRIAYSSEVVRVGQRPAGPMQDRRTKRNRDRSTRERKAIEDQT